MTTDNASAASRLAQTPENDIRLTRSSIHHLVSVLGFHIVSSREGKTETNLVVLRDTLWELVGELTALETMTDLDPIMSGRVRKEADHCQYVFITRRRCHRPDLPDNVADILTRVSLMIKDLSLAIQLRPSTTSTSPDLQIALDSTTALRYNGPIAIDSPT